MSTITAAFTKEQLIAKAIERRDHARKCLEVFPGDAEYEIDARLAEIALAALDDEPKQCSHGAIDNDDGALICLLCGREWDV